MEKSISDLKRICLNCNVLEGKSIKGSIVKDSELSIKQWIEEIKVELYNGH